MFKDVYRLFGEYSFFLVMQVEEKNAFSRMLGEIKTRDNVIEAGPVLLCRGKCDWDCSCPDPTPACNWKKSPA